MTNVNDETLGKLSRQWVDLFRRVREGSVDAHYASAGLQSIIEGKFDAAADNVYQIAVDYSAKVSKLLKQGKFDYVNDYINDKNFPAETCSCCGHEIHRGADVDVHIVHFNRTMTSDEVKDELDKQGLRPANVRELLAFGAQHPDVQRKFPVIALGSECVVPGGDRYVPYLGGDSGRRIVSLYWLGYRWDSLVRFAAVSK